MNEFNFENIISNNDTPISNNNSPVDFEDIKEETQSYEIPKTNKYAVIGLGQGGGNVAACFNKNFQVNDILCINTSIQDLEKLTIDNDKKLLIGNNNGAGKNIEKSRNDWMKNEPMIIERIKKLVTDDIERILIIASLGGGTGAGTLLPCINTVKSILDNKKMMTDSMITVCLILPKKAEITKVVKDNCKEILTKLIHAVKKPDACFRICHIDNDAILKTINPNQLTVFNYNEKINFSFVPVFASFIRLSNMSSSIMSLDSADCASILSEKGFMFCDFQLITYDKMNLQFDSVISKITNRPNFDSCKYIGIIIYANEETYNKAGGLIDHIDNMTNQIKTKSPDVNIHTGISVETLKSESIKIFTIGSGLEIPIERYKELGIYS